MTDSPTPPALLKTESVPVDERGEYPVDVHTVLTAIKHDPRAEHETALAVIQLSVWHGIKGLIPTDLHDEVGATLLDLSFPDWRTRALVQLAAALAHSMGRQMERLGTKERPTKMLVIGGKTATEWAAPAAATPLPS